MRRTLQRPALRAHLAEDRELVEDREQSDTKKAKTPRSRTSHCLRRCAASSVGVASVLLTGRVFCLNTCCGGERLVAIPGVGVLHVPTWEAASLFSFALPLVAALYLAAWTLAACLCWRRRPLLALAIAVCAVPWLLRGPVGFYMTTALAPMPVFKDAAHALAFADDLRAEREGDNRTFQFRTLVGHLEPPAVARSAAQWLLENRQRWTLHGGARGTPHFSMGFRYPVGWLGVAAHGAGDIPGEMELMWGVFGELYEALRAGVEAETGTATVLHRELNPPAFLINLPFGAFHGGRHSAEVHTDLVLGHASNAIVAALRAAHRRPPRRGVAAEVAPHAAPYGREEEEEGLGLERCAHEEQMTLTLGLKTPTHGSTGLETWRYSHDAHACPAAGAPDASCIDHAFVPYAEGRFVVFPSRRRHATGHGYQPLFGADARIILVAFVLPCGHGAERVLHILPTTPIQPRGTASDRWGYMYNNM